MHHYHPIRRQPPTHHNDTRQRGHLSRPFEWDMRPHQGGQNGLLEGVVYVYQDLVLLMKPVHKDHIKHLYGHTTLSQPLMPSPSP
jgi:hypothetical protein